MSAKTTQSDMNKKNKKKIICVFAEFNEGDTVLATDGFVVRDEEFDYITGQKFTGVVRHKIDMNYSKKGSKIKRNILYTVSALTNRGGVETERRFFEGSELNGARIVIVEKILRADVY
jgi:hypothetical protein